MLQNILIRNIAIANNIEIDWSPGMTSISGETGAGKSILLNSLSLALGDRADSTIVRHGESRAEVVATFNVGRIPAALKWLKERDLDNTDECILRRTISSEGRSRAFINGQPVPLAELKTLGEFLIDIHSQHAHQSLLRSDTHLRLLDEYAGLTPLRQTVKEAWLAWQGLERKYAQLRQNADEKAARIQLLQYQCEELANLALAPGEVEELDTEFKRMSKSESLLRGAHAAESILNGDDEPTAVAALKAVLHELKCLDDPSDSLKSAYSLIESALIQTQEAGHDLQIYIESFDFDDERRFLVEDRLNTIHELARKHAVASENLHDHYYQLDAELNELTDSDAASETLAEEVELRKKHYFAAAKKLSAKRKQHAKSFEKEVIEKLSQLAMPGAKFNVAFEEQPKQASNGIDAVEFHISLNPGQPLQPLAKVASGGELSRVSLAIQVICAEHTTIPTLVFDEVDVGISGATAEIVGHMLRSVGAQGQVICVTHLPQVAALGHNHCIVKKQHTESQTTTNIVRLDSEQRISEIARMLGGIDITAQTRAHAEEMLRSHSQAH
ncbi:DNA repair protein RecN [Reinekea sp. G2M2-21]|uniref:DNA repair protein RecN n=1 Tax=Reinekea sp. G2M2-21 TaxID=2788942 RepID=UPI0018AB8465|nr:DNA repair protein RecN [Reinekea sp. G2M2-21]